MSSVVLLATAVGLLLLAHRRVPAWAAVSVPVLVGLAIGVLELAPAIDAVRELDSSLAFLVAAVPLAALLDRVGFFDAAAERVALGHRLSASLWVFAAMVTTVLNLDASVVLLTPLYVRIARRHGTDPLAAAFQPVLLASLASSALPVSNLTNLIAADRFDLGVGDFVVHLGAASLAATAVGWLAYSRHFRVAHTGVATAVRGLDASAARTALMVGGPVVALVVVGFVAGDEVGVAPWIVALVAVALLVVATRRVPWRSVPWEAAVVAAGLAVLAAAAAPHLGLARLLGGDGRVAELRTIGAAALGANAANNLPMLLVGLQHVDRESVWPLLVGVNVGPVLWASGSLAGLLWIDLVRRDGLQVSMLDYAKVGVRVGLPALAAATLIALAW